jgi:hypothetical protein
MGVCSFCGKPAGVFRHEHAECRQRHDEAAAKLPELCVEALASGVPAERLRDQIREFAAASYIKPEERRALVCKGFGAMVDAVLADRVLTPEEDRRIAAFAAAFGVSIEDFDGDIAHKIAKATLLRDLADGRLPAPVPLDGAMPVNLRKGESVVWILKNVEYYLMHTRTQYAGVSQGISIPLGHGFRYRIGGFRGAPIQTSEFSLQGSGDLMLTNANLYFVSSEAAVRIPLGKIISVQPYADGIQVLRDGASAKPIIFKLDDPMFAANAILKLAHM